MSESICKDLNLTKEESHELLRVYAEGPFRQYLDGEITNGHLLSAFSNLDELTTNEKCFLTAQIAYNVALVDQKRRAEAAMAGIFRLFQKRDSQ
jgi:hypothetical protein